MVGTILGAGMGLAGTIASMNSQEKAMNDQWRLEQEKMALQAKYNKEQADYSQQLALDMWNATNYESQVEHMKAAGLNPALLYSKGGAGGSTAGAGTAAPVSEGTTQAVGMGLQAKQIAIGQAQQMAETAKTVAEAAKISGVDTDSVKTSIKKMLQDIEASKAGQEATEAGTAKTKAETKVIDFTNWLNDAKKKMTYWKDGEAGNYADTQAMTEFKRMLTEQYGLTTQEAEYVQNKEIIDRLEKHLDEIVNGKVALYHEQVEKAKQAKNETARKRWELEQDKALSDIIDQMGGDGKYGRLLGKIATKIFEKL
jgi:hypothetical protein|nr:MAG TPA: DNA pilot protein [Microviridae sp.]